MKTTTYKIKLHKKYGTALKDFIKNDKNDIEVLIPVLEEIGKIIKPKFDEESLKDYLKTYKGKNYDFLNYEITKRFLIITHYDLTKEEVAKYEKEELK